MEVNVMQDILGKNDALAEAMKADFAARRIFVLNLMGSPGSGKTTLLEATLRALSGELRMAVSEGDLFTSKDADRIGACGAQVVHVIGQVHDLLQDLHAGLRARVAQRGFDFVVH